MSDSKKMKPEVVEISGDDALNFFIQNEEKKAAASGEGKGKGFVEFKSGVWFHEKLYACRICLKAFTYTKKEAIEEHMITCTALDASDPERKCTACYVQLRKEDIIPHYKSASHQTTLAKLEVKLQRNEKIAFSATNDGPDFVDHSTKHLKAFELMGMPLKNRVEIAQKATKTAIADQETRIVEHIREATAIAAKNTQQGSKELAKFSELVSALRTLRGFASLRNLPCEVGALADSELFAMYHLVKALQKITPANYIVVENRNMDCAVCKQSHPFHHLATAANVAAICTALVKKITGAMKPVVTAPTQAEAVAMETEAPKTAAAETTAVDVKKT